MQQQGSKLRYWVSAALTVLIVIEIAAVIVLALMLLTHGWSSM
jgi:hypothetical protein